MTRPALVLLLLGSPALAQDAPATEPPEIADNSFLLEEAYNQEYGVVQHISLFTKVFDGDWLYTFTQEWPVPDQRHQLSVTLPVTGLAEGTGIGDIALNYRYQALDGTRGRYAFSPRVSLLLPTGSALRGLGAGGFGVQANLPLSTRLGSGFVAHSNLGATWISGGENADGDEADLSGLNAGQSLIWTRSPVVQPLVELAWNRFATVVADGQTETFDTLYLSPGVRWAHNFASGLQIVPGVAVPIGLGPSAGDTGFLVYLSVEHPFRKP